MKYNIANILLCVKCPMMGHICECFFLKKWSKSFSALYHNSFEFVMQCATLLQLTRHEGKTCEKVMQKFWKDCQLFKRKQMHDIYTQTFTKMLHLLTVLNVYQVVRALWVLDVDTSKMNNGAIDQKLKKLVIVDPFCAWITSLGFGKCRNT